MRDGEISDAAWAVMGPLLPPAGRARGRWRDHRQVLEGIVFKSRTGLPWRDLPERFGPWQTVHGRFARWAADGTVDRLLVAAQGWVEVDWLVAIDSTTVRAHQHTARAGPQSGPCMARNCWSGLGYWWDEMGEGGISTPPLWEGECHSMKATDSGKPQVRRLLWCP
ncbi:IS5 family transposase [Streptomyces griseus]|uniref:IS5 family transposase n=1 Tax=Streptomyces griseus TaxID=1911 RepID=UPI00382C3A1D